MSDQVIVYRDLFDKMFAGFAYHEIILDEAGNPVDYRFIDVNPAFETLTGLDRDAVIGKTVLEVIPSLEKTWIERYGEVALTGTPARFRDYAAALGRWYEVFAYSTKQEFFAVLFIDVTEQELYAQKLQMLQKRQTQFIQNVSHELRTPISLIVGYAEMLQFDELADSPDDQMNAIDVIVRRARSLVAFVDDILAILEVGQGDVITRESVDLVALVKRIFYDHRIAALDKGLELHCGKGEPLTVSVDGDMIKQAVDNLIRNAIKFTETGKVTVSVFTRGDQAIIEVQDTGIGIPADEVENVFKRFYQVNGGMDRRYEGTGLGLAVVKEVVESHGGHVEVESTLGVGSTFRLCISIEEEKDDVNRNV